MLYAVIGAAAAIVVIGGAVYLLYRRRHIIRPEIPEEKEETNEGMLETAANTVKTDELTITEAVAKAQKPKQTFKPTDGKAKANDLTYANVGSEANEAAVNPYPSSPALKVAPPIPPLPVAGTDTLSDDEKQTLMNAVWYHCENPYCNYTRFLDVHQIVTGANGGSKVLSNLVVLCPRCLAAVKDNKVNPALLKEWAQKRHEFKFEFNWPYK